MDETIKLWRVEDVMNSWKNKKQSLKEHWQKVVVNSGSVNRINFNPANSQVLVSASEDGTVRIWNVTRREEKKSVVILKNSQIQVCSSLEGYFKSNSKNFPSNFRTRKNCNHLLYNK